MQTENCEKQDYSQRVRETAAWILEGDKKIHNGKYRINGYGKDD